MREPEGVKVWLRFTVQGSPYVVLAGAKVNDAERDFVKRWIAAVSGVGTEAAQ